MAESNENNQSNPPPELQAQILNALSSSSRRVRPTGSLLNSFQSDTEVLDVNLKNNYDLLCPKGGCGSLILLKGVALQREEATFDPIDSTAHPQPASLPTLDSTIPTKWWHIQGSPMSFENIGFTKDVGNIGRKLLICSECDLGPLGWAQGNEYWLAIDRVAYKA